MFGEANPKARLTAENVDEIRARARNGETGTAIAKELGMSQSHISAVIGGKMWRNT